MDTLISRVTNPVTQTALFIYHRTHWFTDKEAWMLFRLFAYIETLGWTLLITAIIWRYLDPTAGAIAVSFAGTIHGLFFGLYFLFVFLTARSMEWGFWRISLALLAGMPPFTSLIFEQAMTRHRTANPPQVTPPVDMS